MLSLRRKLQTEAIVVIMAADDASLLRLEVVREDASSPNNDLHERVSALYATYSTGIYKFLMGQGLSPAVAQEVTQDVFVDLFLALRKGESLRSERCWLYVVAARAAVDHWRREGRPVWVELDSQPEATSALRSREASPELQASEREQLLRVSDALRRLPKEQRLGIHLRMQGLHYREIGRILGVPKSTVTDWIIETVERLRGELHD